MSAFPGRFEKIFSKRMQLTYKTKVMCLYFAISRPMEFFIKFDTAKSGSSIVYIERLQVVFLFIV